jgi:hypothetical protein
MHVLLSEISSSHGGEYEDESPLRQGFSDCGKRTTSSVPATVQLYTRMLRKNQRITNKKLSINSVT